MWISILTRCRGVFAALMALCLLMAAAPAGAQEAPVCAPGERLFTHELLWREIAEGVCIPEQPQRVAYAWPFHVPALVRSGAPLVGLSNPAYIGQQFPAWADSVTELAELGLPPNLEVALTLHPDVIIEPSWAAEENYAELSAVAPVVAFQFDGTHQWKPLAQMYFDILGLPGAYDSLIAEYEARAQELARLIGQPEDVELSLIWVSDSLNLDTDYSSGGILLADVGFVRPASQVLTQTPEAIIAAGGYPYFTTISWEEAPLADGDFIIAYGDFTGEEGEKRLADLQANSLWQSLSAVQAGNVYYTSLNWAGGDIAGAHNLLDDLAVAFGVADQLSPNPYAHGPTPESTETPDS
jgi:iron complex transport system substrate-binding protein